MAKITERTPGGREVLASSEPLRPTSGTFRLGEQDIACAMPPMLWRFRLLKAFVDVDEWSRGALYAAAIGMCWGGPDGPPEQLSRHRRDPIGYGELIFDWLLLQGATIAEITSAGAALINLLGESLPQQEAIDAAADPSGATKEPSTAPSSPSESPGTATRSPATGSHVESSSG